jgi:hypothetical protein
LWRWIQDDADEDDDHTTDDEDVDEEGVDEDSDDGCMTARKKLLMVIGLCQCWCYFVFSIVEARVGYDWVAFDDDQLLSYFFINCFDHWLCILLQLHGFHEINASC